MNIKKLPLRTEWIEYPDIEALYHTLGIEATAKLDGKPYYTLPVIHDPHTNTTISESFAIVQYLDKTYPDTPTLLPRGTLAFHKAFVSVWGPAHNAIHDLVVCAVWRCLNQRSQTYFRSTREEWEGKKLEDIAGEAEWSAAEGAFAKLDRCLGANGEGMDELVMGNEICFADLQIASALVWAQVSLGEHSPECERIWSWNGGKWKRLLQRFAQWQTVDRNWYAVSYCIILRLTNQRHIVDCEPNN